MIWWTLTRFFLVHYGIGGSTGTYATSFLFFGLEHIRNLSDSESTSCAESQLSFLRYTCFFPPCHLCSTCVIAQKENDQGAKLRGKENWKLNDFYCSKWKREFSIRISCLLIICTILSLADLCCTNHVVGTVEPTIVMTLSSNLIVDRLLLDRPTYQSKAALSDVHSRPGWPILIFFFPYI